MSELRVHEIELAADERYAGPRIVVLPERRERLLDAEPNTFRVVRERRTQEVR